MALTPTIQASQGRVFAVVDEVTDILASQARVFAVVDEVTDILASQARVFTVYSYPSEAVELSQARVHVVVDADTQIRISQARVYAVVIGRVSNRRLKAWGFTQDGHDFYVLRLGDQSTIVYDLTTGTWSTWSSPGLNFWRAVVGTNWSGLGRSAYTSPYDGTSTAVAGDDVFGRLWLIDPETGYDQHPRDDGEDLPFTRKVVGGLAGRLRETQQVGAVYLTASIGEPQITGATISLRTSDDNGKTWQSHGTITANPGEYEQEFVWRSLGLVKAPGRIFEVTDDGATVRIDSMDSR